MRRLRRSIQLLGGLLGAGAVLAPQLVLLHLPQPVRAQATGGICASPGRDGSPGALPNAVINSYFPGQGSIAAGATTLSVGARTGAATDVQPGDLLLIIQMQGATFNSANTDAYGNGAGGDAPPNPPTALTTTDPQPPTTAASGITGFTPSGEAGRYEYVVATNTIGAAGGTVTFRGGGSGGGLLNNYATVGASPTQGQQTYQVVRVPQYTSAALGNATAGFWNGSTGGVLAYDVAGSLTLTGTNDASGRGFRGGGGTQLQGATTGSSSDFATLAPAPSEIGAPALPAGRPNAANGSKGEGIAGTPRYLFNPAAAALIDNTIEGYPGGSFGRGAPGTAGGGSTDGFPADVDINQTGFPNNGNFENSGGGGGANGGFGGIGGRAWNLTGAPTPSDGRPSGGFGGAPFLAAIDRIILGGGGGAGTTNDSTGALPNGLASSGAPGGGVVIIRTGSTTGAGGTINANGTSALNVENDGGGGGGAGGSVIVRAQTGSLAGLTINVNGGQGGSPVTPQPHGPGGGGGGGAVFATPGATVNRNGGASGVTGPNANDQRGATAGQGVVGAIPQADPVPGVRSGAECLPQLSVAKSTSTPGPLGAPNNATYTLTVSNAAGQGSASGASVTDTLPTGFTIPAGATVTPVYSGGASGPASIGNSGTATAPRFGTAGGNAGNSFTIPDGGSVSITFTVAIAAGTPVGTYQNPAAVQFSDPTSATPAIVSPGGTFASGQPVVGSNYDPASSPGEDVQIIEVVTPLINKSVRFLADNDGTNSLTIGDDVQYTIVVRNPSSTAPITSLVLRDIIPSQLRVSRSSITVDASFTLASTLPATDFDATGTPVTLTEPGTLPANGTVTLRYSARILPGAASPIQNQALANYAGDAGVPVRSDASNTTTPTDPGSGPDPGTPASPGTGGNVNQPNASPTDPTVLNVVTPIQPQATKSVRLFSDADGSGSLSTGDVVLYTVTYTNAQNIAVTGFQARDFPPAGVSVVPNSYTFQATGTGTTVTGNPSFNGTTDTNITSTTPGTIAANGGQLVITYRAVITAPAGSQLRNQAVATFAAGGTSGLANGQLVTDAIAGPSDLPQLVDDGSNSGNLGATGDDEPTLLTVQAGGQARLLLVKRVTSVTRAGSILGGVNFGSVVNDSADVAALQAAGFQPVGVPSVSASTPLQSGDEVAYTVYYLVSGGTSAIGVSLCDPIPQGTSLIANTAQVQTATGAPTAGGTVFSPLAPLPSGNSCPNQSNPNGAVIFNLGDLSGASGSNFGFVRFRVRVN